MPGQLYELPEPLQRRLKAVVAPGERVLWAAQPTWQAVWGRLLLVWLFGVFWAAISFPMAVMAVGAAIGFWPVPFNGQPIWPLWARIGLPLFFVPFVVIGLVLLVAPILGLFSHHRTVHAVTDRRLIDVLPWKVVIHGYPQVSSIRRADRKDGTGSLTIGLGVHKDSEGDMVEKITEWSGVPDARRAEHEIRRLAPQLPAVAATGRAS